MLQHFNEVSHLMHEVACKLLVCIRLAAVAAVVDEMYWRGSNMLRK